MAFRNGSSVKSASVVTTSHQGLDEAAGALGLEPFLVQHIHGAGAPSAGGIPGREEL